MFSSLVIPMFKMLLLVVKSVLPIKKRGFQRKKKPITKHSKLRVIVEHTIQKKYGIIGTKFRNKLSKDNNVSDIVSGLINFRIIMEAYDPYC